MAYGAVGCLELTIERLLYSPTVQNSSPNLLKPLYKEIISLKEALREFNTCRSTINLKKVKTLEAEIIDVVYQFEDVIDPHLSNQFHSQSEEDETGHSPLMLFSVDLREIKQDVDSFIETVKKMKKAYIHELRNPSADEDDCVVTSRIDFGGNESNMVGVSDLYTRIKDRLNSSQSEQMMVALLGMAGIGKTTIAKKLFQDPSIVSCYTRLVFVTIGPKYRLADILLDIIAQLYPNVNNETLMLQNREKPLLDLKCMVFKSLEVSRYLIMLDDVWDRGLCSDFMKLFPDRNNGSRVLVTTRIDDVAACAYCLNTFRVCLLDKKKSWDLLRKKVYGEQEAAPYEFEKAGKKIAENCEGLPLTIVTVANILSKVDKTLEYWTNVADDKQHSVYKDAFDQMSNVLYPSYDYLEQHLKASFLYFGAFPQNYLVTDSTMVNLWSAEGLLQWDRTPKDGDYLQNLFLKSVIMFDMKEKGYYLHSSFWYLCNKEGARNKLFYALKYCADDLPEEGNMKCQRRLCIRNSVLLAIKDVQNSITFASKVRSLLCTGPYLDYPVPFCLEHVRLLKVLHALKIRFYEFPMEVMKLVQLRYFSLTYDGNLPTSVSKLLNLQFFTVGRHVRIVKPNEVLPNLPIEIWNMKELTCLHILGRNLPHPCHEGSLLPNLLQLIGVHPQSCTKDVFEKIPNLKVLVIHAILPHDATEPLSCFDHIFHLHKLKELKCYIDNPTLKMEVVTPLAPLSDFPSSLTMLTLSGLGYPWKEMSKISSLPNLNFLTLQCYAFRGPKWEVREYEFPKLQVLSIEDNDVEEWTFRSYGCFPAVLSVNIEHCYKLQEIPLTFGKSLMLIQVLDCNPMAVNWANKLKQHWDDKYGDGRRSLNINIASSWDDGNIRS